jgi:hypothetical protein
MTESMADLIRTEAEITALAERRPTRSDDPALRMLASWAADIDSHAIGAMIGHPHPDETLAARQPDESSRRRTIGLRASALAVVLTLSSSGMAAAVGGDPFAPLTYVVTKIKTIGDDADRSNTIFGQGAPGSVQLPGRAGSDESGGHKNAPRRGDAAPGGSAGTAAGADAGADPESAAQKPSTEAERGQPAGNRQPAASQQSSPSGVIDVPDRPRQDAPRPSSGDHGRPAKPRRLPIPDAVPSPHGPDGPEPEKPGAEPAPEPETDPTLDPGTTTEPPPDTPS